MWTAAKLLRKNALNRVKRFKTTELTIGDVTIIRNNEGVGSSPFAPEKIPAFFEFDGMPNEVVGHLRWMAQKYSMGQDMFLCGHPGPLRRRLALTFANAAGLDVEYVAISRDTTENDLKQRREIRGNNVVFHDQAPVRAAIHGRLLALDGIEYAERNVLPTLNNLLENREMALEDGRFLTTQKTIASIGGSMSTLVGVHPDFRVVALGQCVPPYNGRTMDPPLRSRFQSRFIDELSSESMLELLSKDTAGIDQARIQAVIDFYESLRLIRTNALHESTSVSLTGLPIFSLDAMRHTFALLRQFPDLPVSEAVARSVPGTDLLIDAVPSKFKHSVSTAMEKLVASASNTSRNKYSLSSVVSNPEKVQQSELQFKSQDKNIIVDCAAGDGRSSRTAGDLAAIVGSLMPTQREMLSSMLMDHALNRHICIMGPRGSGKSHLARTFADILGYRIRTLPLYQEATARDLLQRRVTESESADSNKTAWVDSPLITAARNGDLCVLDGVERVDPQVLFTLRMLLQDGVVDLPSGERLSTELYHSDPTSVCAIKPGFRVIALGLTPSTVRLDDARERYLSSALGFSFLELQPASLSDVMSVVTNEYTIEHPTGIACLHAPHKIDVATNDANNQLLERTINSLQEAGAEHPELKLSVRHVLRLHRLLDNATEKLSEEYMKATLERTLMIPFMPSALATKFQNSFAPKTPAMAPKPLTGSTDDAKKSIIIDEANGTMRVGAVSIPRRQSSYPELVPRPLFHENSAHLNVLAELMYAFQAGERALLLIGNQGVGKNKLVDRLLEAMNAEREYIQLHRDTTIQSLTILPNLEGGRIKYEDSPMIRAARLGRVLVVDEADKAPLEVVCLLKALAEDGEVILYDGRRLLSSARLIAEGGDPFNPPSDVVVIHPQFALFVLANRPGFPFLGNNFFRECGDAFSVHVVENLDFQSEMELLRAYGPTVHESVLSKLAGAFSSLREAHSRGDLSYPFSAREAVAVVKHLQVFPQDGVASAVEDILGFDSLSPVLRRQIATIFQNHGLPVPLLAQGTATKAPPIQLSVAKSLPQPHVRPVVFQPPANVSVDASFISSQRAMRKSDWTANVTHRTNFTMDSLRLLKFSEEVGRVSLSKNSEDSRQSLWTGRVLGMVADNTDATNGSLHVLTSDPLTIHSFVNVGATVDALRGRRTDAQKQAPPQLVRRELLSEDLAYRLGAIQPLLVPMSINANSSSRERSHAGFGCAVLIPDMSMALAIPSDPSANVSMFSLPLKSVTQQASDKYKEAMRMFGKGNGNDESGRQGMRVATSSVDQAGRVLLYRRGDLPDDLIVLNFSGEEVCNINLSESLRQIGAPDNAVIDSLSSLGHDKWALVLLSNGVLQSYLAVIRSNSNSKASPLSVSVSRMLSTDTSPGAQVKDLVLTPQIPDTHNQYQFTNVNAFAASSSSITGGTEQALVQELAYPLEAGRNIESGAISSVKVWPRPAPSALHKDKTMSVILSSSYDNSAAGIKIVKEENSLSRKSKHTPHLTAVEVSLEAVDLNQQTFRHVNLHRPITSMDPMFSVVSVAPVATQPIAQGVSSSVVAALHADGIIRLFETDSASLSESQNAWSALYSSHSDEERAQWGITKKAGPDAKSMRGVDQQGKPRTGLNAPKHGKEDPENKPHVGGNTWAGGTGGSDTAGLGGRGGPYRLDMGHTVHQVSPEMKAEVSEAARAQARKIAREALNKRLEEIQMGKNDYHTYMTYKRNIEPQIGQLRATFEELSRRARERVWLRHQTHGDLDDSKLVDGLTGDRLVFKRRGVPDTPNPRHDSSGDAHKKRLQFVVDVSGSMYRFNGQDRRLERMLEAVLLLMEAMPSPASNQQRAGITAAGEVKGIGGGSGEELSNVDYCISGHSGDSDNIRFLDFNMPKPSNEQERLEVLEGMVAHSQFCSSGDNTLGAVKRAIDNILTDTEEDQKMDRFVLLVSDANFDRYGISPQHLAKAMTRERRVQVHFILIASLADEAERIAKALPAGKAHICYDTSALPNVLKGILTSAIGQTFDT